MRAPIGNLGEDTIGVCGEAAIGKEHGLDPLPKLFIGKEQKAFATIPPGGAPVRHNHSHRVAFFISISQRY